MPTADFQRLLEERGGSSKDIIIIIIIFIFIIGVVSGGLLTFLNVFFFYSLYNWSFRTSANVILKTDADCLVTLYLN